MTSRPPMWRFVILGMMLGMAGLPIYLHAPKFYSDTYSLSLTSLGLVLFALRGLDVIQDPILGMIAARTVRFGAAPLWIAVVIMGLGMLALFSPVIFLPPLVWFCLSLAAVFSGFSFLYIRVYALGLQYYSDHASMMRLSQMREGGNLLGVCLAAMAPTVLLPVTPIPFFGFAVGFVVVCVIAVAGVSGVSGAKASAGIITPPTIDPRPILQDHSLRQLLILGGFNALPVAVTSTLFLFFVEYRLGAGQLAGPLLIGFFLSAAVSAPVWSALARRFDAFSVLMGAMVLSVVCFVGAYTLTTGDSGYFALICVLSGATLGADMVILPAVFSVQLGQTRDASQDVAFGLWTFVSKLSLAITAITVLPAVAMFGFDPNTTPSVQGLNALSVAYALVPCLLKLAALAMVWHIKRSKSVA